MYNKYKNKYLKDNNNNKRNILFTVIIIHFIVLVFLFIAFSINNIFFQKLPDTINVSIVSANEGLTQNKYVTKKIKEDEKIITRTKQSPFRKKIHKTKKWIALDPSKINKSSKIVTKKERKKEYRATSSSTNINKILKNFQNISYNQSENRNNTTQEFETYYNNISKILYQLWEQPYNLAVTTPPPKVIISIKINKFGRVINASIISSSGIKEMDKSVQNMINRLTQLPAPPNNANLEIQASMVLTN